MEQVFQAATPYICLMLGFILNSAVAALRDIIAHRSSDAEYRARILTHIDHVEKRLGSIDESVQAMGEFRGSVTTFIDATDARLARIERKLDCDAARH